MKNEVDAARDVQNVLDAVCLLTNKLSGTPDGTPLADLGRELEGVQKALSKVQVHQAMHPNAVLNMSGGEPIVGSDLEQVELLERLVKLPPPLPASFTVRTKVTSELPDPEEDPVGYGALILSGLDGHTVRVTEVDGRYVVDLTELADDLLSGLGLY